jgi:hypothetical protein
MKNASIASEDMSSRRDRAFCGRASDGLIPVVETNSYLRMICISDGLTG